ncbi:MAG TPA: zinc-dependent metalloprotease, partial [Rubrivivax sp.]|nr:zinc-dependent metalloprotease [Rubrivivax sp.]
AASGPSSRPAAATAATPPAPGTPPPFAVVIKDARRIDGPLTFWQKDDKVWIELLPSQFDQPWLLSPKIKSGISEAWVLGGLMALPVNGAGGAQLVEFKRVHNQVRLQARNTDIAATPGSPEARAVADSYSHSLLGAVPVVSQPHPDRKSVLIEASPLFLTDMLGIGMLLQRGLRQGYGLDRSNSVITAVRSSDQAMVVETQNHFYTASLAVPTPGAPPGAPVPQLPRYLPDTRSLLVSLSFSLAPLPAQPMAKRRADPRIGLFTTTVLDFSAERSHSARQRFVNRWRLEKKDPAAELSDPVKPITFWIDRNVPQAYRETVRAAILEWNKAFEKIGFRGAIAVEQQADDAKFDTLDFGYASVRWMMNASPAFGAIGPSHVDPRSGEILDADVAFEGTSARDIRQLRSRILPRSAAATFAFAAPLAPPAEFAGAFESSRCLHGALAAEQLAYALDVMEAQGEMDPEGPLAQQFVQDYVKEVILHEVGHALGLRHNFRASRVYSEAQLADAEFTRAHGTTGSVMEYNAVNLPLPGQSGGVPFQTTLGPYDYWAIEYAYKPLPAGSTPQAEQTELMRIAARSHEPLLAYGTDEDQSLGLDPETLMMDLGADPLAFAAKRLAIARELFRRQETRELSPERDYAALRRSIAYALNDVARSVAVLVRQIGGVRTLRDFPGSGRDPLQPVPAEQQRRALSLVSTGLLAAEGLQLSPALQRRVAPDFLDRAEGEGGGTDFPVAQRLLDLQRAVLGYLMSDAVAARILDSVGKFDVPAQAFQLGELHERLARDLWGGLAQAGRIDPSRRELQREHVNRLAAMLLRPLPGSRVDARGLVRSHARRLLASLDSVLVRRGALDADTRAHLADCADTLRQAMQAPLQRQGL